MILTTKTGFKHKQGFGLVELMVAISISLVLLAGIATMFVSSRGAYETNDRLARLEENGRFALEMISRDIRSAGYTGCSGPNHVPIILSNSATSNNDLTINNYVATNNSGGVFTDIASTPVAGFNYVSAGTWNPALPSFLPLPADGSDVLLVRGPSGAPVALAADMTNSTAALQVAPVTNGPGFFKNHELLMITDCLNRTYFEVAGTAPTTNGYNAATGTVQHFPGVSGADYYGNANNGSGLNDLGTKYTSYNSTSNTSSYWTGAAQIFGVRTEAFYIAPGTASTATNQFNSLWRWTDGTSDELIEGVDAMQLRYGLDTDDDGIVDDTESVAPNPSQILSITVSVLVHSLDEYGTLTDKTTYQLLGSADSSADFKAPGDRRMRQIFSTTIWVRNEPRDQ